MIFPMNSFMRLQLFFMTPIKMYSDELHVYGKKCGKKEGFSYYDNK